MSDNKFMLRWVIRGGLALALIAALALGIHRGIVTRIASAANVREETVDIATPTVSVVTPKKGSPQSEIVLPGNVQAFTSSPIYARISGYLKKWYFDIGGHVKQGDLLAEIDAPEVDQQLAQARGSLKTAQATLKLAEITMNRDMTLMKDAIAKQDLDNAIGAYEQAKATVESQSASVKQLEQMVAFEKVYAPFDGIVTARNTDIGALVNAGNGGTSQQLFAMAATQTLRVYISVPQVHARAALPGTAARLSFAEYPGRFFAGKIVRNAEAIDPALRTLLTEVDVENASGALMAGAFAEVHLMLPQKAPSLIVPVNALLFRAEGLQAGVVRDDGTVQLVQIVMGKDYGTEVEVVSGLSESDRVIVNPPDSLATGTKVRVAAK
jgi:RND family efflux transporter MFP subunit